MKNARMAGKSKLKNFNGGIRYSAVVELEEVREWCTSCFCGKCPLSTNDYEIYNVFLYVYICKAKMYACLICKYVSITF